MVRQAIEPIGEARPDGQILANRVRCLDLDRDCTTAKKSVGQATMQWKCLG